MAALCRKTEKSRPVEKADSNRGCASLARWTRSSPEECNLQNNRTHSRVYLLLGHENIKCLICARSQLDQFTLLFPGPNISFANSILINGYNKLGFISKCWNRKMIFRCRRFHLQYLLRKAISCNFSKNKFEFFRVLSEFPFVPLKITVVSSRLAVRRDALFYDFNVEIFFEEVVAAVRRVSNLRLVTH